MKRILLYILIGCSLLGAQTVPENAVLLFDGGRTKIDFTFYWQMLSGGQNIGFFSAEPWDIWANPAGTVAFSNPYLAVGFEPALAGDPAAFVDINATVREEVDNWLVDYKIPESQIVYPQLETRVGQRGGLYGFQLAYPLKWGARHGVISLDFGQPFLFDLNIANNGLTTMIETRKVVGDQDKLIHMRLNTALNAAVKIKAMKYRAGYALMLGDRIALGLGMGQTFIDLDSRLFANINGIMETAGAEYVFNDPYDPRIDFAAGETNRLDQSAQLDFNGSVTNFDTGLLYRLSQSWMAGLSFSTASKVALSGKMNVTQFKIPALNTDALFDSESTEDLVDPTKLNLAKLTLTEPVINKTADVIDFSLPGSVGVQLSYQKPIFETTLSYRSYLGEFGYTFLDSRYFLDLAYDLNLDIVLGFFKLSVGGSKGQLIDKGPDVTNQTDLWLPHGSLEVSSYIMTHFYFSTKLFVEPTPGVGVKLGRFF